MSGKRPTICVDMDGTIAAYDGWKGLRDIGMPLPGAREFMAELAMLGRVVVHTCRTNPQIDPDFARVVCDEYGSDDGMSMVVGELVVKVQEWLDEHDIPYDEVWSGVGKPIAYAYVDDRAVPALTHDYARTLTRVKMLLP